MSKKELLKTSKLRQEKKTQGETGVEAPAATAYRRGFTPKVEAALVNLMAGSTPA